MGDRSRSSALAPRRAAARERTASGSRLSQSANEGGELLRLPVQDRHRDHRDRRRRARVLEPQRGGTEARSRSGMYSSVTITAGRSSQAPAKQPPRLRRSRTAPEAMVPPASANRCQRVCHPVPVDEQHGGSVHGDLRGETAAGDGRRMWGMISIGTGAIRRKEVPQKNGPAAASPLRLRECPPADRPGTPWVRKTAGERRCERAAEQLLQLLVRGTACACRDGAVQSGPSAPGRGHAGERTRVRHGYLGSRNRHASRIGCGARRGCR
jgi:hypothetical protein